MIFGRHCARHQVYALREIRGGTIQPTLLADLLARRTGQSLSTPAPPGTHEWNRRSACGCETLTAASQVLDRDAVRLSVQDFDGQRRAVWSCHGVTAKTISGRTSGRRSIISPSIASADSIRRSSSVSRRSRSASISASRAARAAGADPSEMPSRRARMAAVSLSRPIRARGVAARRRSLQGPRLRPLQAQRSRRA